MQRVAASFKTWPKLQVHRMDQLSLLEKRWMERRVVKNEAGSGFRSRLIYEETKAAHKKIPILKQDPASHRRL